MINLKVKKIGCKKKGFTILEVVLAITIVAIAFLAIATSFDSSFNIWKKDEQKISISSYSINLANIMRNFGYSDLNKIGVGKFYVYFDSEDEFIDEIEVFRDSPATSFDNIKKHNSISQLEWENKSVTGKDYGAIIELTKPTEAASPQVFTVRIILWDFTKNNGKEEEVQFYIGR